MTGERASGPDESPDQREQRQNRRYHGSPMDKFFTAAAIPKPPKQFSDGRAAPDFAAAIEALSQPRKLRRRKAVQP